jgi:hypothetical protein
LQHPHNAHPMRIEPDLDEQTAQTCGNACGC